MVNIFILSPTDNADKHPNILIYADDKNDARQHAGDLINKAVKKGTYDPGVDLLYYDENKANCDLLLENKDYILNNQFNDVVIIEFNCQIYTLAKDHPVSIH